MASVSFVVVGVGGILVGVVLGWLLTGVWRKTGDPTLEIVVSLLAPIVAYLTAETLGVSGVLATVTAGLIAGRRAARVLSPDGRLMGTGVWAVVYFLIDSFVFMLIGLQLPLIVGNLSAYGAPPADRSGSGGEPDGDPRADPLDLPDDLPAVPVHPVAGRCSTRHRRATPSSSCRGPGCAAPCRWPPRWPCRSG